jgi:hypothetical protein
MKRREREIIKAQAVNDRLEEIATAHATTALVNMMEEWKLDMMLLVLGIGKVELDR